MAVTTREGREFVDLVVSEHIEDDSPSLIRAALDVLLAEADTGWITPPLLNSWVNFGSGMGGAGYRKVGSRVSLRGTIKDGTSVSALMFALPAGYRPAFNLVVPVVSNGVMAALNVFSAGGVQVLTGGSTAYVSLDGISFLVG